MAKGERDSQVTAGATTGAGQRGVGFEQPKSFAMGAAQGALLVEQGAAWGVAE